MNTEETVRDIFRAIAGFIPEKHDYVALTYVSGGNGDGEIQTATYKQGGSSGETVVVITITYNASNEIATITSV